MHQSLGPHSQGPGDHNLVGLRRTAQARWSSEIPSNLVWFCSAGSRSSILKTWLDDVGPKDGICKSTFWFLPRSSFERKGHEGRPRPEDEQRHCAWEQGPGRKGLPS